MKYKYSQNKMELFVLIFYCFLKSPFPLKLKETIQIRQYVNILIRVICIVFQINFTSFF